MMISDRMLYDIFINERAVGARSIKRYLAFLSIFYIYSMAYAGPPCESALTDPAYGVIRYEAGQPVAPDHVIIPLIVGDGIGPEVTKATQAILEAAVKKAYGENRSIRWIEVEAGLKAFQERGSA